jgi:hypothetical protein
MPEEPGPPDILPYRPLTPAPRLDRWQKLRLSAALFFAVIMLVVVGGLVFALAIFLARISRG